MHIDINKQFSVSKKSADSSRYQLTAADIGLKFGNLIKNKHVGHVFNSILGSEFEF